MSASTILSVRVSAETKDKLDRLAAGTKRTKSFLAAEAIVAYVARELAIIDAIEVGLEDVRAGRTVSQDEVEAEIYALIEQAEAARRRA